MPLLASLFALGLFASQPNQQTGAFTLFNDQVSLEAPKPVAIGYSAAIESWPGWGPLASPTLKLTNPFPVDGDWTPLLAQSAALKADPSEVPFRVRVFLLPSVDLLYKTSSGNLDERRTGIYGPNRARIEQALGLAAKELEVQTSGRLKVVFDTSVDSALYEETVSGAEGLGADALRAYVRPRINGGSFEANDKLYHGPYDLCLVVHAGLTPSVRTTECGTPVCAISAATADASTSECTAEVMQAFEFAAAYRSSLQGRVVPKQLFGLFGLEYVFGDQTSDQIAAAAGFGPISGDTFDKNFRLAPYNRIAARFSGLDYGVSSANADLGLTNDSTKGSVLTLKLSGVFPHGGFVLPWPAAASGANHFLVFDFRSSALDSIGVGPIRNGIPSGPGVGLGTRSDPGPYASFAQDGGWHKVAIDLGQIFAGGPGDGVYIGFMPGATRLPRNSMVIGAYDFAGFSLATEAPADASMIATSSGPAWEAQATAARNAAKSLGTPEGILAMSQYLGRVDDMTKLNALDSLTSIKAPALEDKIAAEIGNVNPRITESAIAALAFQDTPTGWATLTKTIGVGPGTHAKAVAATFVALRKDPSSSGPISAVQGAARDWHDRALAAKALASCGTSQAWLFLYNALTDDDPAVRSAGVEFIDPADETGMRRLMFLSVNDASDEIRASACTKLLQSSTAEIKKEGYRGVNDDSWWVRVRVLDWITTHPSADDRPAVLQALASPYAAVRAAALKALAASQFGVSIDEISGVVHDQFPSVQLALIALAKAKTIALPADVVSALKASADPAVVAAAASLANT